MADNKKEVGKSAGDRVNVKEEFELQGWAKRLGVTQQELKKAVKKVGPLVSDLKAEFAK